MNNYPFALPAPVDRVEIMGPHFTKHYLSDGRVLHHFTQADTGDPHDHPFSFRTTILFGGYTEDEYVLLPDGKHGIIRDDRLPGQTHTVEANTIHRIIALLGSECWTLMEPGLKVKEPGFYQFREDGVYHRFWHEQDWRHYSEEELRRSAA